MKPFPHRYEVRIAGGPEGYATLSSGGVPDLRTAPPLDFDGLTCFGPVRVAVTGSRISPPLFESLEILGRDKTLARLAAAAG